MTSAHSSSSWIRRASAAPSRPALIIAVVVAALAGFCFTEPGAKAAGACHRFLDYYSGVFSLVALSLTVMGGLAATDRLILLVRHRILLQAVHRAIAAAAVGFLAVHIAMKIIAGHARLLDAVVPFLADHRAGYVGLGTVGAYLMVIAGWTGLVRGRFAEVAKPWLWRLVHSCAYAAWPVSLLHGLASGRPAPGWVKVSYSVCLIAVGLALLVRVSVHWGRTLRGAAGTATGTLPRVGAQRNLAPPTVIATPTVITTPTVVAADAGSYRADPSPVSPAEYAPPVSPADYAPPVSPAVYPSPVSPAVYPSPVSPAEYAGRHSGRRAVPGGAAESDPFGREVEALSVPVDATVSSAANTAANFTVNSTVDPAGAARIAGVPEDLLAAVPVPPPSVSPPPGPLPPVSLPPGPLPSGPPPQRRPHDTAVRGRRRPAPRAADLEPAPRRTFESVSDEEFWAFMRGERS